MSKASQDKLAELHNKVADKLLAMIESDEATPQDLAQAIKFLKDNNIAADIEFSTDLQKLKEKVEISKLPFPISRSN